MNRCAVIYLLLCVLKNVECAFFTDIVQTSYGKVRGIRGVSGQNLFYGITYATSERLQPPKEPTSWEGIFYAVKRFGECAQRIAVISLGSEDCLRLDMYTPSQAKPGDKLPVLVFIHGGAYYYGSKMHYDPEFLVSKNVITVIVNYRVGLLGFLCLNKIANLGMKDQVAALAWIQKNIAAFGGDPDNVTLSGQSAGASAAAMHMLSASSKGLFHKLLLMSGSPLAPWAINLEPQIIYDDIRKVTQADSDEEIYSYLMKAPLDEILAISRDTSLNPRHFKYTPCVDNNSTEPFLRDTPYNIIKSGQFTKVPILTGVTSAEGILFYGLNNKNTLKQLDEEFTKRLPSMFSWCSIADRRKISKRLRSYYFGSEPIRKSLFENITNFYTDWLANSTAGTFTELMTRNSDQPVYSYVFNYDGDRNFAKALLGGDASHLGASHSDDLFYVFKPAGISIALSNRDRLFIDRITTMFANFMKFGNPTPYKSKLLPILWPPVTNSSMAMRLDAQLSVVPENLTPHQLFYRDLMCTYGQEGYAPCDSVKKCNI